ncbi:MAG: 16S rRNA (guanine(527)-N(7))-methyltransferase RsmG [Armatimonadetes bacterium]|nr:16S rRNA (guanine(527)-N(7))-methyltransferase RsmG [Anaerolineae bacterium]
MMLKVAAFDLFGLNLTPEQVNSFDLYTQELSAWNARMNLTAITEPDSVIVRHYLDSLSVVKAIPLLPGMRVMDVGTGAGFPGLPLHIAIPGLDTTLLEATGKKVAFLDHLISLLGLKDIAGLHGRAEEVAHQPQHRASYDVVLARAVARLPILLEYLLPFAKIGGYCIAMKGATAAQELEDSAAALATLGGRLHALESITLPGVTDTHYLVVIEKIAKTPWQYPRSAGLPVKNPLM